MKMTIPNLNSSYSVGTQSLLSLMPDPVTNTGVFQYLTEFPFIDPESANMEYLYNRSGDKVPSSLVSHLAGGEVLTDVSLQSLAKVIKSRFAYKWNRLWAEYSDENPLYNNVNLTTETQYGKLTNTTTKDTLSKSGTETHAKTGSEISQDSYPTERKTTHTIEGGWNDDSGLTQTRTGIEDVTETYPESRTSIKAITGGYKDTDTTSSTRTGKQTVTDKGDTLSSTFGFNSSSAVPTSRVGPADSTDGITQETQYDNLSDTKSGNIARSYDEYKEQTTETGSRKVSTTYGDTGLKDESSRSDSRLYKDYKEEFTESGTHKNEKSFNNVSDTVSFDQRIDDREVEAETSNSGKDTVKQSGYNIRRATDRLEIITAMYNDPMLFNFFEIIYSDMDEVLTIPAFMF